MANEISPSDSTAGDDAGPMKNSFQAVGREEREEATFMCLGVAFSTREPKGEAEGLSLRSASSALS